MVKFYVSGMTCDGCANSVQKMLSDGLGVPKDDVEVDLKGAERGRTRREDR